MFDTLSDPLKFFWKVITCVGIIIILTILLLPSRQQTNLDKFNAIDIDLAAAGINKDALLKQFKQDPLACRQSVVQHKRKRFLFITPEQEKGIGRQFVSAMETQEILYKNQYAAKRCNSILERLAKAMPENFTPPSQIYILDVKEINACCLPDGTVIVFRGLLDRFNDDEVAWVIAHELGHGTAHHAAEMLSKTMIQELAIDTFVEKDSNFFKLVGSNIAAFFANLKYSRVQEDEADRLALYYMNKAGFNLQGAISALNKFKQNAGDNDKWKELLSTHPHPENRLKNVETAIGQLKANPDHSWGGLKEILIETAKVKAIKYYLKKKAQEKNLK